MLHIFLRETQFGTVTFCSRMYVMHYRHSSNITRITENVPSRLSKRIN